MVVEVHLLREGSAALHAEERSLAGVDAQVTFQIPLLREAFPAEDAPVGFLPRVDHVVYPQSRRIGEGLPAQLARLGDSLGGRRGHAFVWLDFAPLREMLLTDAAEVRLVRLHVLRQHALVEERPATDVTREFVPVSILRVERVQVVVYDYVLNGVTVCVYG